MRLEPTPYCQYTRSQRLGEGEEVDREVSPPILNIEEKEQPDNLHGVNRELGNPPNTKSPEGLVKEEGASQGYESSSEESVEEENNLVGRDTDESMEEDENGAALKNNIGMLILRRRKREQ